MSTSTVTSDLPTLVGGALCLDFANTVDPRHSSDRYDYLSDYPALVAWSAHAGVVSPRQARTLERRARQDAVGARAVHRRALALRDAVYDLFAPTRTRAPSTTVTVLNDEAHLALAAADLTVSGTRWAWEWRADTPLDRVLWPVARSAAELLVSDRLSRVRECEADSGCGWLFLDTSKNGRRRWCDMRVCGNRAKARRRRLRDT